MADWARVAVFHLRGARGETGPLLKPESFQRLQLDRFHQEYALGWAVLQRGWAGGMVLNHTGTNTFWYAVTWAAPARSVAFLAATNCGSQSGFDACDSPASMMARKYL